MQALAAVRTPALFPRLGAVPATVVVPALALLQVLVLLLAPALATLRVQALVLIPRVVVLALLSVLATLGLQESAFALREQGLARSEAPVLFLVL